MHKKLLLTSFIILVTFITNAQDWWSNKKVKGNGTITTIKRTIDEYEDISVGGSFDVILIKGKEGNITIEGEENVIPYLETKVEGNTLKIKYKKNTNIRTTKRMTITVSFKDIERIALGGSGNISSTSVIKGEEINVSLGGSGNISLQIEAEYVKAAIGGSGNINLSGNTTFFKCSIAGSGDIKAFELKSNEIDANVAGSGSIKTTVKNKINAKMVGSGSIYYKGNPKYVDSKTVGSGDIIDKN